jgi:hypothetical protein
MSRSTPVHYDPAQHRVWLFGQRCHHGATGALLAAAGVVGLAAGRLHSGGVATFAVAGAALMAHDWKDRALWFEPGPQSQP